MWCHWQTIFVNALQSAKLSCRHSRLIKTQTKSQRCKSWQILNLINKLPNWMLREMCLASQQSCLSTTNKFTSKRMMSSLCRFKITFWRNRSNFANNTKSSSKFCWGKMLAFWWPSDSSTFLERSFPTYLLSCQMIWLSPRSKAISKTPESLIISIYSSFQSKVI